MRNIKMPVIAAIAVSVVLLLNRQKPSGDLQITEEQVNAEMKVIISRFENIAAMKKAGITDEKALRMHARDLLEKRAKVEKDIAGKGQVSEEEAKSFYEKHKPELGVKAAVKARHIFLATLDKEEDTVKAQAETIYQDLIAKKKTFEALGAEFSEDERNKKSGGELGVFSKDRLAADFTEPVFALEPQKPEIIRTKIGYHIVEVLEKFPARERSYDECKAEIIKALGEKKRQSALQAHQPS